MPRVLLLAVSLEQAEQIHATVSAGSYPGVEFRYPATLTRVRLDLASLYDDCCDVIREEQVTAVVSMFPGLELLQAVLLKDFPKLRGPSCEAVFVGGSRRYGREIVLDGFSVASRTLSLDGAAEEELQEVMEELGCPAVLREPLATTPGFSRKVRTARALAHELGVCRAVLEDSRRYVEKFIQRHVDLKRYDEALSACAVVDEYVKPGRHAGTLHLLEACVVDGVIVPWVISDIGLYKQRPVVVRYVTCPSMLDEPTKFELWAVYREMAQRLIALGFDNQFLQMEIFMSRSGAVRALNLTPSLNLLNITLYRHVLYQGGDSLLGQVDAALGRMPREPHHISERHALRAVISSQIYSITLDQVFHLALAKTTPEVRLLHTRDTYVIDQEHADEDGVHLAHVQLFPPDCADCVQCLKTLCHQIVKPWPDSKHQDT